MAGQEALPSVLVPAFWAAWRSQMLSTVMIMEAAGMAEGGVAGLLRTSGMEGVMVAVLAGTVVVGMVTVEENEKILRGHHRENPRGLWRW